MALSDQEYLEANAHLSTAEILQDVIDTQEEIDRLQEGKAMSFGHKDRIDHMRAQAARDGIAKRKQFIVDLERLLELRRSNAVEYTGDCQHDDQNEEDGIIGCLVCGSVLNQAEDVWYI